MGRKGLLWGAARGHWPKWIKYVPKRKFTVTHNKYTRNPFRRNIDARQKEMTWRANLNILKLGLSDFVQKRRSSFNNLITLKFLFIAICKLLTMHETRNSSRTLECPLWHHRASVSAEPNVRINATPTLSSWTELEVPQCQLWRDRTCCRRFGNCGNTPVTNWTPWIYDYCIIYFRISASNLVINFRVALYTNYLSHSSYNLNFIANKRPTNESKLATSSE